MNRDIIVALFGFLGTAIGSGFGVIASSKLTNHRIQVLERKVDEHNNTVSKTIALEATARATERRLNKLEQYIDRRFD